MIKALAGSFDQEGLKDGLGDFLKRIGGAVASPFAAMALS